MQHLVFSNRQHSLKVYIKETHQLIRDFQAHNEAIGDGYGHDGMCPLGDYELGTPESVDPPEVPYNNWFIPLIDVNGLWNEAGRAGIGIHGGGTGSPHPFDPIWQGEWIPTEGCIRVRNGDQQWLAENVKQGDTISIEE